MDLGSLELGMLLLKWLTANNDKNEVSTPCAAISLTRPESALGPIWVHCYHSIGELCDLVFIFTVSGHSSVTQHFPPENATPPPLGTLITLIPPNSHLQAINLTNIFSKTRNRFAIMWI